VHVSASLASQGRVSAVSTAGSRPVFSKLSLVARCAVRAARISLFDLFLVSVLRG